VSTKKEKAEAVKERLSALIGKEAEYELDEGREYQGQTTYKIKSYPGKPEPGQGGGGRQYVPRFNETEKGFLLDQQYVNARCAVMQAVALLGPGHDVKIGKELSLLSKGIFKILTELTGPKTDAAPTPPATRTQTAPREHEQEEYADEPFQED
jgi:hypothetical protein